MLSPGALKHHVSISTYHLENAMKEWIDPAYCDVRLGFEVTAYVYVR